MIVLELFGAFFSTLHNVIGENMVNPEHEETPRGSPFYSIEVTENILNFFLFELGCFGVSTLMTLLFLVPYDKVSAKNFSEELKKKGEDSDRENNAINEDENKKSLNNGNLIIEDYSQTKGPKARKAGNEEALVQKEEYKGQPIRYKITDGQKKDEYEAEKVSEIKKTDNVMVIPNPDIYLIEGNPTTGQASFAAPAKTFSNAHLRRAYMSFRVWKLFTIVLCSNLGVNLILITWKVVGITVNIPTEQLQLLGSLIFIFSGLGTSLFAFLSEKIPFNILFTLISAMTSFIGFAFPYTFGKIGIFMVFVLAMNFNLGGYLTVLPKHYKTVFGDKHYMGVAAFFGLANAIMNPICAFFAFFVDSACEDKEFGYKIIFISGAALNIVSLILSALEDDEKFDF